MHFFAELPSIAAEGRWSGDDPAQCTQLVKQMGTCHKILSIFFDWMQRTVRVVTACFQGNHRCLRMGSTMLESNSKQHCCHVKRALKIMICRRYWVLWCSKVDLAEGIARKAQGFRFVHYSRKYRPPKINLARFQWPPPGLLPGGKANMGSNSAIASVYPRGDGFLNFEIWGAWEEVHNRTCRLQVLGSATLIY